jgi:2-polyprenyl-3-methyl-5-hydroxy-6-metoxy-1,4-benzoquinol methylase
MASARPSSEDLEKARRTPCETFELIYAGERDPWRYESRAYERVKYERTLAALGGRRYGCALEIGSSIGVFTEMLAERCDRVVALEPSGSALRVARDRCGRYGNVEFLEAAAPEGLPDGLFDLTICSEVLYYLGEAVLDLTLTAIEERLAPGGTLIAVHYRFPRGPSRVLRRLSAWSGAPRPATQMSGQRVHRLLRAHTGLRHSYAERNRTYLLDRFDDG